MGHSGQSKLSHFPRVFLALLCCVALVVSLVPTAVFAEAAESSESPIASGSTTVLSGDMTLDSSLAVTADTSIDLAGHTLTINAGAASKAGSDGASGAISVTKGAKLAITDSSNGKGGLLITLGAQVETSNSVATPYQGIAVSDAAALTLDGVGVRVVYTGESNTNPAFTLRGIALCDGSLTVKSASLATYAAQKDDAFGATDTVGIWVAKASKGDVSIDSASNVSVVNNAQSNQRGMCNYLDNDGTTTTASTDAAMIELDLDESSEIYQDLVKTFRLRARYDSSVDTAGNVYGTQVYYMADTLLDCGVRVWAYSDVVSGEDAGKLENIVPTHVFVYTTYYDALNATGIECESGFDGAFVCAGNVSSKTSQGNACGLRADEDIMGACVDAKITTVCSAAAYRTKVASRFDLNDFVEMDKFKTTRISYPTNAKYAAAAKVKPQARGVATWSDEEYSEWQKLTEEEYRDKVVKTPNDVEITYSNLHSSNGKELDSVAKTCVYGTTPTAGGAALEKPSDYVAEGVTYRFVGWNVTGAGLGGGYSYEHDYVMNTLKINSNITGATSGSVSMKAVYVAVKDEQHLVVFRVDNCVAAYAVKDGEAPAYSSCYASFSSTPKKLVQVTGYDYDFKGWLKGDSSNPVYADGDSVYEKALPAADADVVYSAKYVQSVEKFTLFLTYWREGTKGYVYSEEAIRNYDWNTSIADVAQKYVKVGDSFDYEGTTYTFEGWSTRVSDVEPLITDSFPTVKTDGWGSNLSSYYGIYSSKEKTYAVKFYVDGQLYAENDAAKAGDTLYQAFEDSTNPVQPVPTAENTAFRGWNSTAGADSILLASVLKVSEAAGDADTLELHAIWRSTLTTVVTFYDSDGKTVIDQLEVDPGSTVEASTGEDPKPTGKNADLFTGWADADGNAFSVSDTIVNESIDVYAQYKKRNAGSGTVKKNSTSGTIKKTKGFTAPSSSGLKAAKASMLKAATTKKKATPAIAQTVSDGGDNGSGGSATTGAEDTQNAYDVLGTGDAATVQSIAALVGAGVVFAALVAGIIVFFHRRRATDDEELAVAAEAATESIRF